MRSALGLLPQGLQVRVQRLAAALLLAGRVRLGQQDLRPLLGAGVDARAGLGLLDVLLVLRGGAGGGRRQARGGGRGAAVLGGGGFRKLRKRGGAQRCRLRQREVGRVGSGRKRRYQNLAWTSPRPLSFLLEEKLAFLFSEKRNGPSVNAPPDPSHSDRQRRKIPLSQTHLL